MEFVDKDVVLAIHDRQLAEHGGLAGMRDEGLLDSAMARPQNRHAYGSEQLEELAAAYAYGIARNHPFLDGNKRTAWAVARTFLAMNGLRLVPDRVAAVEQMVLLAEGLLDEAAFAVWLGSQPRR
ncbi:type II toxin-antitoxin system death-on-curing family toxin [Nevskia sp.]|uniref:type II toxin-antitoxin system death-on-curing family toxin n=1 Tax=Nevskia sp. TaxID=1929292 RepID=UPI0025ED354C|nr:type II toxin-antitoxin system death-on-curing family toxin [Nevskia sp.]